MRLVEIRTLEKKARKIAYKRVYTKRIKGYINEHNKLCIDMDENDAYELVKPMGRPLGSKKVKKD